MKRDSMLIYKSFVEAAKDLSNDDFTALFKAIFAYGLDEQKIDLQGQILQLFTLMKPQIEANNRKYKKGCKGGRPKKKTQEEGENHGK